MRDRCEERRRKRKKYDTLEMSSVKRKRKVVWPEKLSVL